MNRVLCFSCFNKKKQNMISFKINSSQTSLLFVICVMMFGKYIAAFSDISIETFNNSKELTEIQINSCHLLSGYDLHFFDIPMTWLSAMGVCHDLGYTPSVTVVMNNWLTGLQIIRFLESIQYKSSNYAFWTGHFRPYHHVTKWFQNFGAGCKPYIANEYPTGNFQDGRCSVIRKTFNSESESTVIDDCTKEYPFVCHRFISGLPYQAFKGFHVNEQTLGLADLISYEEIDRGGDTLNNTSVSLLDQCLDFCGQDVFCNGITYDATNDSSPRCILIRNSDFSYNISSEVHMTHYAKSGCDISIYDKLADPVSNRTFASIADCDIDEIPESYYPCVPGCPVEDLTSELIAALTVDKKSTTKYHRKYVSSQDDRPSSKSMGAVGIIIIIIFIAIPPLCDTALPRETLKKAKKKVGKTLRRRTPLRYE